MSCNGSSSISKQQAKQHSWTGQNTDRARHTGLEAGCGCRAGIDKVPCPMSSHVPMSQRSISPRLNPGPNSRYCRRPPSSPGLWLSSLAVAGPAPNVEPVGLTEVLLGCVSSVLHRPPGRRLVYYYYCCMTDSWCMTTVTYIYLDLATSNQQPAPSSQQPPAQGVKSVSHLVS